MVKEYCLIPKSRMDKHFNTPLTSPTFRQGLQQPGEKVLSEPKYDSTVDDLMRMSLKAGDYEYGKTILSFLRKKPLVKWDRSGELTYPIRDINIVEAIKYFVTIHGAFDSDKIGDLRLLVRVTGLPESLMRNPRAKKNLFPVNRGGKKKKTKKIKWVPY